MSTTPRFTDSLPPNEEGAAGIPFITDDVAAARLERVESALTHIEYQAGCVKREIADLRRRFEPRQPPSAA